MIADYPCPVDGGGWQDEFALAFEHGRTSRVLIVPALFEEASRMRRLTVETMRRLDGAGIDTFLPELPGCGESCQSIEAQTPEHWRAAMAAAAVHFAATHVLAIRGGALVMPDTLPGWRYAPVNGAALLRTMLRARVMTAREAGSNETTDALLEQGRDAGLELAGYRLSSQFISSFNELEPVSTPGISDIEHTTMGGAGLWLRAEPGEDRHQADALAAYVAMALCQ